MSTFYERVIYILAFLFHATFIFQATMFFMQHLICHASLLRDTTVIWPNTHGSNNKQVRTQNSLCNRRVRQSARALSCTSQKRISYAHIGNSVTANKLLTSIQCMYRANQIPIPIILPYALGWYLYKGFVATRCHKTRNNRKTSRPLWIFGTWC